MHVATNVHMILKRFEVLTWMYDHGEFSVAYDIMEQHKADTAIMTTMCASVWFEFFWWIILRSEHVIYDNKEGDLDRAHPLLRVSGYKRGSDIR